MVGAGLQDCWCVFFGRCVGGSAGGSVLFVVYCEVTDKLSTSPPACLTSPKMLKMWGWKKRIMICGSSKARRAGLWDA